MKMFNPFQIFETVVSMIVGMIGGYILKQKNITEIADWILFITSFLIMAFVVLSFIHYIMYKFRDKFSWYRAWFSKHYIEGRWVQIIDDPNLKNSPPTKFTFLRLFFEDGEIKVNGSSYNEDGGCQTTTFHSLTSEYNYREDSLTYIYKFTTDEKNSKSSLFGETKLIFGRYNNSKHLNKYKGAVSSNLRDNVKVFAIRIDENNSFSFSTEIGKQKVIASIKQAFLE